MTYLRPVFASIVALLVLFIITKLMGKRQIAQLSFFDYIIGISIGSIAAEMSVDGTVFWDGVISIFVYGVVAALISIGCCKSTWLRRFVSGGTTMLYEDGVVFTKNLLKAKIDLSELLTECRFNGYYDLSKVYAIMLEQNGKLSFIPLASDAPVTTADLNITNKTQEKTLANVILDGKIIDKNLRYTGNNHNWLTKELAKQPFKLPDIAIATCDENNTLTIFPKGIPTIKDDVFS